MQSGAAAESKFSVGSVTRFYVPLLLQGFSQSLAYPLVAGIVTHGEHGVDALTAFSQGQMVMFMIGAIGGGLITTGLVFAKTWMGYVAFKRLNTLMMSALLAVQCVAALPPFSDWLFSGLFALTPELAEIASRTLLYGVVMNGFFFLRNVPMVVLFDNLESAKANYATFIRLVVTFALAVAFPQMGLVGPWWGLAALTFGVGMELVQLAVSLGWLDVSSVAVLAFVFKNSLYSGVFAMVGGLVLVPLVSLVTQKTKPANVDAMFECYNATKTVEITDSLGD